ncbi:kelch-like protein 26 [Agrilus planipennis]|uniref:Kelch-like protein diablo n=1 Tax=Agrilus planipennis TaxID=224129 RepID=A0A1W4WJJ5_AGRPL|nr:kelch-like protein 26 [Agrilus planipennis]XP_018320288.1 kelch-like protein 26 [Agrilus planipennis]
MIKTKVNPDKALHAVIYEYQSHHSALLEGLNSLREQGQLLDIILEVEEQFFSAHKAVLAACSDYFRAMFTEPMIESRQKQIRLNGLTAKGIRYLIDYAYTSRLALNQENVQDVLAAATHCQMLTVVQACSSYLQSKIDVDNCVDIATIAENYSLSQLKTKVYTYMSENLLEFSNSCAFYRLSPQQLETLLAYEFPVDCTEADVLNIILCWFFHSDNSELELRFGYALRILRKIHFSEIPSKKLEEILEKVFSSGECERSMYKLVLSEAYRQKAINRFGSSHNLLNSRGMELALLKIGGFGMNGITNEITYCLSSDRKWRHLTSIPHVEQCNFGTAVFNNELYVVGGCFNQSLQEDIHPFGFKYSPRYNKWTTMAPMQIERCRFSLNVVGNKLYAVGGVSELEDITNEMSACECYDPHSDSWHNIPSLPEHKTQHAGATYEKEDLLFVSGGMDRDIVVSTMYCYNSITSTWRTCSPMLTPRADHAMLCLKHKLYVCGGWMEESDTRARILIDSIDAYNILEDSWEVVTRIPTPRYHAGIVIVDNKIYFIGGFSNDDIFDRRDISNIDCYDVEKNVWTTESKYPQVVWEHTCATLYVPKYRDDLEVLDFTSSRS